MRLYSTSETYSRHCLPNIQHWYIVLRYRHRFNPDASNSKPFHFFITARANRYTTVQCGGYWSISLVRAKDSSVYKIGIETKTETGRASSASPSPPHLPRLPRLKEGDENVWYHSNSLTDFQGRLFGPPLAYQGEITGEKKIVPIRSGRTCSISIKLSSAESRGKF